MSAAKKNAGEAALVTFVPSVSFTGFPKGEKTKFTAGVESAPVPAEFLEKMRAKGFVRKEVGPVSDER